MRHLFPNGWYADATPDRAHAVLMPSRSITTSRGSVHLPRGGDLLALRCAVIKNVLCLVGQGHDDGRAWLWVGNWFDLGQTYGTSPCAFGPDGDVYISTPGATDNLLVVDAFTRQIVSSQTQPIGARGIAHVDSAGRVTGVDEWYGREGFAEYTDLDGVRIGQGAQDGIVVRIGSTARRLLESGSCKFVHASRDGDLFAVAAWKDVERAAVVHYLTLAELTALPLVSAGTPPPPPSPPPPPPEPEPIPMALPNHLDTLVALRAEYPAQITAAQAVDLLNRVAWLHRDDGFGLLAKPNGNHAAQPTTGILCSCDWLTNRNGLGFDALRDGPDNTTGELGEAGPTWGEGEPFDLARFVAPVQPVGEVEPPPPGPVDPPPGPLPSEWQSVARRLDSELMGLRARVTANDAAIEALENRLGTALPQTLRVTEIVLKVEA